MRQLGFLVIIILLFDVLHQQQRCRAFLHFRRSHLQVPTTAVVDPHRTVVPPVLLLSPPTVMSTGCEDTSRHGNSSCWDFPSAPSEISCQHSFIFIELTSDKVFKPRSWSRDQKTRTQSANLVLVSNSVTLVRNIHLTHYATLLCGKFGEKSAFHFSTIWNQLTVNTSILGTFKGGIASKTIFTYIMRRCQLKRMAGSFES